MSGKERFWASRLRWRLRGATAWPAFVAATLLEGVILDRLPPVSTTGLNYVEGVLIATFGNLILVGALAPFLAKRLARRQPAPAAGAPGQVGAELLRDRVATALLAAGIAASLAAGLANRPLIVAKAKDQQEAAQALNAYVMHSGNEELIRNNENANGVDLGQGLFRICIAGDDRRRYFCFFVDTKKEPTEIKRDPSAVPNGPVPSG